jgi:hypothetical protein
MRPSATSVPTPTEVASAQYLALASRVNSEWRALGALPAVGAPLETRQRYQAEWFAIEEEVVAGLAAISWPATAATEAAALAGAASTVRTLLQPNDKSGQFLELISFTTRDQTSAATALRVTLGLPAMEVNDLL